MHPCSSGVRLRSAIDPTCPNTRVVCVLEARINDALRRLTRPFPSDAGWDHFFQHRRTNPCCAWLPNQRTSFASCGHDLSLEHAVTDNGACRACLNAAILRGSAA